MEGVGGGGFIKGVKQLKKKERSKPSGSLPRGGGGGHRVFFFFFFFFFA